MTLQDQIDDLRRDLVNNSFIDNLVVVYNKILSSAFMMAYIMRDISRSQEMLTFEDICFNIKRQNRIKTAFYQLVFNQTIGQPYQQYNVGSVSEIKNKIQISTIYTDIAPAGTKRLFSDNFCDIFTFDGNQNLMMAQWKRFINGILDLGSEEDEIHQIQSWNQQYDQYFVNNDELSLQLKHKLTNNKNSVTHNIRDLLVSFYLKAGRIVRLTSHGLVQMVRVFQILIYIIPDNQYTKDIQQDGILVMYSLQFLNHAKQTLTRNEHPNRDNILSIVRSQMGLNDVRVMDNRDEMIRAQRNFFNEDDFQNNQMRVIKGQLYNYDMFQKDEDLAAYVQNTENVFERMIISNQQIQVGQNNQLYQFRMGVSDTQAVINQHHPSIQQYLQDITASLRNSYNELIEQFAIKKTIKEACLTILQDVQQVYGPSKEEEFQPLFINIQFIVKVLKWNRAVMELSRMLNSGINLNGNLAIQTKKREYRDFMNRIFQHGFIQNDSINNYYTVTVALAIDRKIINDNAADYLTQLIHTRFYDNFFNMIGNYGENNVQVEQINEDNTQRLTQQQYDQYCQQLNLDNDAINKDSGFSQYTAGMSPFDIINGRVSSLKAMFRVLKESYESTRMICDIVDPSDYQKWQNLVTAQQQQVPQQVEQEIQIDESKKDQIISKRQQKMNHREEEEEEEEEKPQQKRQQRRKKQNQRIKEEEEEDNEIPVEKSQQNNRKRKQQQFDQEEDEEYEEKTIKQQKKNDKQPLIFNEQPIVVNQLTQEEMYNLFSHPQKVEDDIKKIEENTKQVRKYKRLKREQEFRALPPMQTRRKRPANQDDEEDKNNIEEEGENIKGNIKRQRRKRIPPADTARVLFNICQMYQAVKFTPGEMKKESCFADTKNQTARAVFDFITQFQNLNENQAQRMQNLIKFYLSDDPDRLNITDLAAWISNLRMLTNRCLQENKAFYFKIITITNYKMNEEIISIDAWVGMETQCITIIDIGVHIFLSNKNVNCDDLKRYVQNAPIVNQLCRNVANYENFLKTASLEDTVFSVALFIRHVENNINLKLLNYRYEMKTLQSQTNENECKICQPFIISFDLETYQINDQIKLLQANGIPHWDYCCAFFIKQFDADERDDDDENCNKLREIVQKYNAKSPIVSLFTQHNNETSSQQFLRLLRQFQGEISQIKHKCSNQQAVQMIEMLEMPDETDESIISKRVRLQCYAYNGAKFDSHFIYRAARREQMKCEITGNAGEFKQLKIEGNIMFRDARQLCGVPGKLSKVAESLKLNVQKDKLDIALYVTQEAVEQNIDSIKTYCQIDCLVVDSLLSKMLQKFKQVAKIFGKDESISKNIFLSSLSISRIALQMYHNFGLVVPLVASSCDRPAILKAQQDAYRGGLTEALYVGKKQFNITDESEQFYCFDFNSLYPSIMQGIEMLTNLGCMQKYTMSSCTNITSIDEFYASYRQVNPNFANYRVFTTSSILKKYDGLTVQNEQFPLLNFHPQQGDQDIYYLTKFQLSPLLTVSPIAIKIKNEGTLYPLSFDLAEFIKKCGKDVPAEYECGVAVHGFVLRNLLITKHLLSFSFKERVCISSFVPGRTADKFNISNIFGDYIRKIYTERMKAKQNGDQALAEVFKLLMNSLYGKFGQKDFGSFQQISETQFLDDTQLNNAIFKVLSESCAIFNDLKNPNTIFNRAQLQHHMHKKFDNDQIKLEFIESLDENVENQYKLSFKSHVRANSQIGGLVHIASTISAIGAFLEASLINYTSSLTMSGKKGVCLYGDTDSVFINDVGKQILQGKEQSMYCPYPLTIFQLDNQKMLSLKQETPHPIQQIYIFGRKFYAYKTNDEWTFKCKGIQNSSLQQFEEIFSEGRSTTSQTRFVKKSGFVEQHERAITNHVRLKQFARDPAAEFCKLRPFRSVEEYFQFYTASDAVLIRADSTWQLKQINQL